MTGKQKTVLALGVFSGLLLLVLLTSQNTVSVGVPKLQLPTIDKTKVTAIEITGPKAVTLERSAEGWLVGDPTKPDQKKRPADTAAVTSLLEAISGFKAGDFVTDWRTAHADYEVDSAKAERVVVRTGNASALDLFVGKDAPRGGSYVRSGDGDAVFQGKGNLAFMLRKDPKSWTKLQLFSTPVAELTELAVKPQGGEGFTLKREGAEWKLDGPPPAEFRFDSEAAGRVVASFAGLRAQELGDASAVTDAGVIEAKTQGGKTLMFQLGKPNDAKLTPARVEGDDQVYLLPEWSVGSVNKSLADLRDLSLMRFEVGKVSKVAWSSGKQAVVAEKQSEGWKIVKPTPLPAGLEFDPSQVDRQLQTIQQWKAVRVVAPAVAEAQTGLSKPEAWIEVTLEGGGTQRLTLGQELAAGGERYAKGAIDGLLYAAPGQFKATLDRGVELFRKPPAPPPDSAGMQGLDSLPADVRRQIESQLAKQRGQGAPGHQ